MLEITITDAEFYAFHGYYAEERIKGGQYLVSIKVHILVHEAIAQDNLADTLNYETLYQIAKTEMAISTQLIETLAHNIAEKVKQTSERIIFYEVEIKKLNPPLGGKLAYTSAKISNQIRK